MNRFAIKKSTTRGAGRGLFTRTSMAAGQRFQVRGVLVRRGSPEDRHTRYADPYKFRVGNHLLIPLCHGGMVNHSATPCLEKIIEGKKLYLRALRPIKAGEELFFRYSAYAKRKFILGRG